MKKRIEHHTVPGIKCFACVSPDSAGDCALGTPIHHHVAAACFHASSCPAPCLHVALAWRPALAGYWAGGRGGPSISNSDVEYIGIVLMWGILAQGTEVQYLASKPDRSSIDRVIPVELTRSGREGCDSAREASRPDMVLGGQAVSSHSHERRSQRDAREALRSALRWEWGVV